MTPDATAISDPADTQAKPCYDQSALMRRYDVIAEICDSMLALGWKPYQNDHEDANGQFEMNWEYDDALVTADRHSFFKYMAKSIAEKHGLRATFMPKPFAGLTGNGCHSHVSLWKGRQEPVDDAKGELGVSKLGYQFLPACWTTPRRWRRSPIPHQQLQAHQRAGDPVGRDLVAQHHHLYRQQPHPHDPHSRSGPFRAAPAGRFGQSYLLQAALLAAGLDGIAGKKDPGKRLDITCTPKAIR